MVKKALSVIWCAICLFCTGVCLYLGLHPLVVFAQTQTFGIAVSQPTPAAIACHAMSLQTASAAELETLPGIGPVVAGRIIAYRTEHAGFVNVEELMRVEGIGVALFKKLRPLVCVCGMVTTQTTELLSINTANAQALVGLPGIGEKLAAEIVANRAQYGRFDTPEDLLRVPGIGERKLRAMLPFIARDAAGKLP